MTSQQMGLRVASLIFALFTIVHIVRLVKHFPVQIGSHVIPIGASWIFVIMGALLCIWMWRLSSTAR
ncbi:MAG TPA: hypothetical protein VLK27_02310 [Chthoniobacterales bacterium]|nr:hypothetical protein [Chthoniobacterales bacterium]